MATNKIATLADIIGEGGNVTVNMPKGATLTDITVGKGNWRKDSAGTRMHTFQTWNGLVSLSVYVPIDSPLVSRLQAYSFTVSLADELFATPAEYVGKGKANEGMAMLSFKAKPATAKRDTATVSVEDLSGSLTF